MHFSRFFLSSECVYTSFSHHHTCLKMRLSTECLLHSYHREIVVSNCPLERFLSLYKWTSFSDALIKDCCCSCRYRRCWFRGGLDFPAFVEATVSRCTQEGLTFVSTFFESCEPYSWYSMVGLEDSKHILSKLSSFLRSFWTVIHHPRIIKNFGKSPEYSMMILACTGWYFWILS